jgi:tetratricopeptide (TPR) repeat protein
VRKFEDILKRDPHAYSFAPLADIYLKLGLPDDALQAARKGCVIHPDFAAGQLALARAALENDLKGEAKGALEIVVRITPENLEAQRLLADIYSADGDQAAALHCLAIASSLDATLTEPVLPVPVAVAEPAMEEIADEDILELTDDLIEDETVDHEVTSPFSAAPERPSLGDAPLRAEPFLMETAPPLYQREDAEISQPQVEAKENEAEAPPVVVASATIAELYVSQGFPEKGTEIYRELLQQEPDNLVWKTRLEELVGPAATATTPEMPSTAMSHGERAGGNEGVLETLGEWLANIGRTRQCRTKNA